MSKSRDLSKLNRGFTIDGTDQSRIDSDFVLSVFKKILVKRDNASYDGGADSEVFLVDVDTANPVVRVRHDLELKGSMKFESHQKDSDKERAYNDSKNYTIRTGAHFDSDFAELVVDVLLNHDREGVDPTRANFNEFTSRLQEKLAITRMHDVNSDKAAVVGQYLRWNGDSYEPQDPDAEGAFTIDIQDAVVAESAIGAGDTVIGFSKEISNANAIVFINGVGPLVDSESFGDAPTSTQDSDSDKYLSVEYQILQNVTTQDVDQIVSGPSDAVKFYQDVSTLRHGDEIVIISPIDETIAHFYKNFRFADSDLAVYRNARNHWDSDNQTWVDSEGDSAGKVHQTFRLIDSEIYNDSEFIAARVGGNPLIFLNGINLNQRNGDFYFYDSDSDQVTEYKASRMIAFDSDNYVQDSDVLTALWIRNVGGIETQNFETIEHTFRVDSDNHPGITTGIVRISEITQNSNDALNSLVFINGRIQTNAPVLTYQVRNDDIVFPTKLDSDDFVAIYSFSGPTTGSSTIGSLSNVDRTVDSALTTNVGEALIFDGSQWTHQFANTIAEAPVTAAWMRVTFDSDNGPNPNKIIDRATYGFDSDQLKYSRHEEGIYYFLLDSEVMPVNETNGFYMSMSVSTCAPQGQPIFASIDAEGASATAPGPAPDSETGLTIDVFGGQPLIPNPNNRAIRVRTWDQNGNPIDPIQVNVQVWFKREIG